MNCFPSLIAFLLCHLKTWLLFSSLAHIFLHCSPVPVVLYTFFQSHQVQALIVPTAGPTFARSVFTGSGNCWTIAVICPSNASRAPASGKEIQFVIHISSGHLARPVIVGTLCFLFAGKITVSAVAMITQAVDSRFAGNFHCKRVSLVLPALWDQFLHVLHLSTPHQLPLSYRTLRRCTSC